MSDGTLTPRQVVELAKEKGLKAIAITDHDNTSGIQEALEAGHELEVEVIPGVEISAAYNFGTLHILGYFIDYNHGELTTKCEWLRGERENRISKILNKLKEQGVLISEDDVNSESKGNSPGKPHVANLIYKKGYTKSYQEAFDKYLVKGTAAYVPKVKLEPVDAIGLIVNAGGIAVLAHPHSLDIQHSDRLCDILKSFIEMGLKGIEVYYPQHTAQQTQLYLNMAKKLNLIVTGGTDFHGSNKPGVELGVIPGMDHIPYDIVTKIKNSLH
jgi:predicted metal-dependent phosphoesterase TrpH